MENPCKWAYDKIRQTNNEMRSKLRYWGIKKPYVIVLVVIIIWVVGVWLAGVIIEFVIHLNIIKPITWIIKWLFF